MRFTLPSAKLIFALGFNAALSSFQDGYYLGVINNPENVLQEFTNSSFNDHYGYYLDDNQQSLIWSFIVALYTVGGILGSWCVFFMADRLGRKWTFMIINNFIALAACLMSGLCKLADSWELLAASRFLIGFNSGLATGTLGIYLTECSPVKYRGFFGNFLNFGVTFFTLVSAFISLDVVLGSAQKWPYLLGIGIIPAIMQIIFSPFFPDTPKYLLVEKKDEKAARKSILYYFGKDVNVDEVFDEIRREELQSTEQVGFLQAFRDERFRFPIVLSIVMNIAQVFTGILAIFSYSTEIFVDVGFPPENAQWVTAIMSSFNTVGSILGLFLVETWGRRPLVCWTGTVCLLCDVCVMFLYFAYDQTGATWVGYLTAGFLVIHVFTFNVGIGPIAWFISSEMLPISARSVGASVSVTVNWIMGLITTFAFFPLDKAVQSWSFLLFIIPMIPCMIFLWLKMPETKNRHIDDIMRDWVKDTDKLDNFGGKTSEYENITFKSTGDEMPNDKNVEIINYKKF